MKKIVKKMIILCFVFCVMLGISNVSLAADPTEIYIIDVVGESEVKVDALSDQKGNGWSWDATNKVLTLDNFNGEYINTNGDITINLVGANKITIGSKGYGIIANGNAECLIINGTSSDILKINGTSADVRAGIYANSLIIYGGKLDIDISISKATSNVYGIFTDKSTELYNDANIDALVEVLQSTGTWNLVGIKSLTGVGTGEVNVNVTGVNKVCGMEFLNLNSGNDVEITAKTSSATDFAHACENLAGICDKATLTVNSGIVSNDELFDIADEIKIERLMAKEWIILESDFGYTFVDSITGEEIKDGLKFTPQTKPVDFEFIRSPLFDIPVGEIGDKVSISLIGGARGVNYSADPVTFDIRSGKLPNGLSFSSRGIIRGTYKGWCNPGSVKIIATREWDDEEITFTINYAGVPVENPVASVSLNETTKNLSIGDTYSLDATIIPTDTSTDATVKSVSWKSTEPSIVSVSDEGEIKANSAGTATITVTTDEGLKTAQCVVNVSENQDGFYAMQVDEDDGIIGNKIYSMELEKDESIMLVFFENGVLIENSVLEYNGGIVRNTQEESDFIEEREEELEKNEEYPFSDYIYCIDGFLDMENSGTVSYNGSSVNFILKQEVMECKKLDFDTDDKEWQESKSFKILQHDRKKESLYVRFYYDDAVIDVTDISFKDLAGNTIQDSIVKAEYKTDAKAWLITYTEDVQGRIIINNLYDMEIDLIYDNIYFCNEKNKKIDAIEFSIGEDNKFYLYGFSGAITEKDNADKVSESIDADGRVVFTINECTALFTYSIIINGITYEINIEPEPVIIPEFYALEVKIDGGIPSLGTKYLTKIIFWEFEEKYFVFYNNQTPVLLTDEADLNMTISNDSVFNGTPIEGYVYKISSGIENNGKVFYNDFPMRVGIQDVSFYELDDEDFDNISNFHYQKGNKEKLYLYIEGYSLQANEVKVVSGNDYVILSDTQLNVDGERLDVVEITFNNNIPSEFYLGIEIAKWSLEKKIKITNNMITDQNGIPYSGFFTSKSDRTASTFLEESVYTPGDVFYYICDNPDYYISSNSLKGKKYDNITIKLVDTGKDFNVNSFTADRYALEIKVDNNATGEISENINIKIFNENGLVHEDFHIDVDFEDIYTYAPKGEADLTYNTEQYIIGISNNNDDSNLIIEEHNNEYEAKDENKSHMVNIPIKIFEITSEGTGKNELEVYTEKYNLYNNITSVDAYIATFDTKTLDYKQISNQNCVSVNVKRENAGKKRWFLEVNNSNTSGKHFIVTKVTMDDGTVANFAILYNSYEITIEELDLSSNTTDGITYINEYIESLQKSNTSIIKIKLNPNFPYGDGTDSKVLVLDSKQEIHIDGNGATIIGSVEVERPYKVDKIPTHQLTNIHFKSNSKNIEAESNIGIDGDGQLKATNCSFENYFIAVNMLGNKYTMINATKYCIFKDNKYGIYINGRGKGLDEAELLEYDFIGCKFMGNYTGILINKRETIENKNQLYDFVYCEFIGNESDIINRTRYKYLSYGCVFANTSATNPSTIEARKPRTKTINVCYVYRTPILTLDNNGFINNNIELPNVAYAPYTDNGQLDNFNYVYSNNIGVSISGFSGIITVIGDFDTILNDYITSGKLNMGAGGVL